MHVIKIEIEISVFKIQISEFKRHLHLNTDILNADICICIQISALNEFKPRTYCDITGRHWPSKACITIKVVCESDCI